MNQRPAREGGRSYKTGGGGQVKIYPTKRGREYFLAILKLGGGRGGDKKFWSKVV